MHEAVAVASGAPEQSRHQPQGLRGQEWNGLRVWQHSPRSGRIRPEEAESGAGAANASLLETAGPPLPGIYANLLIFITSESQRIY